MALSEDCGGRLGDFDFFGGFTLSIQIKTLCNQMEHFYIPLYRLSFGELTFLAWLLQQTLAESGTLRRQVQRGVGLSAVLLDLIRSELFSEGYGTLSNVPC